MNGFKTLNPRRLSIAGFSFLFAYILSFQFEGQVLYSLLVLYGADFQRYILAAIIAHFIGLFTCGLFAGSHLTAKSIMLGSMGLCLVATAPFFCPLHFLGRRLDYRWIRQRLCGGSMGIFSKGFYAQ